MRTYGAINSAGFAGGLGIVGASVPHILIVFGIGLAIASFAARFAAINKYQFAVTQQNIDVLRNVLSHLDKWFIFWYYSQ